MNTLTLYPLLRHWTTPLFCKVVDVYGTSLIQPPSEIYHYLPISVKITAGENFAIGRIAIRTVHDSLDATRVAA